MIVYWSLIFFQKVRQRDAGVEKQMQSLSFENRETKNNGRVFLALVSNCWMAQWFRRLDAYPELGNLPLHCASLTGAKFDDPFLPVLKFQQF